MNIFADSNDLITAWLHSGTTSITEGCGSKPLLILAGDVLYADAGAALARKIGDTVEIGQGWPNSLLGIRDKLIFAIAKSGLKFESAASIQNLGMYKTYQDKNTEEFARLATVAGFVYKPDDLTLRARADAFEQSILTAANTYRDLLAKNFKEVSQKYAKHTVDEKTRLWDTGSGGALNSSLRGADGKNLRLRVIDLSNNRKRVESSAGEKIAYTSAKEIWERCVRLWNLDRDPNGQRFYTTRGSRHFNVYQDRVSVGCQTVSKAEVLRIGTQEGWTLPA